jgi:hypothetical protein
MEISGGFEIKRGRDLDKAHVATLAVDSSSLAYFADKQDDLLLLLLLYRQFDLQDLLSSFPKSFFFLVWLL